MSIVRDGSSPEPKRPNEGRSLVPNDNPHLLEHFTPAGQIPATAGLTYFLSYFNLGKEGLNKLNGLNELDKVNGEGRKSAGLWE